MDHYETTLKPQYRFSARSEQLCRHLYKLWLYCIENGGRNKANEICRSERRINHLHRDLKSLSKEIQTRKQWECFERFHACWEKERREVSR